MANIINVVNHEELKTPYSEENIEKISQFFQSVLENQNIDNWDVSVLFCDDMFIQELNKNYRNIDTPTDVLSFEQGDSYIDDDGTEFFCAGDIVISVETLEKNASKFNLSVNNELKRLLVHGILHLNGMDHGEFHIDENGDILDAEENIIKFTDELKENEEIKMLVLQETILTKFNNKKII